MKTLVLATAILATGLSAQAADRDNPLLPGDTWDAMRSDVLEEGVTLQDGAGLFTVNAPYRAHDAATVPLVIARTDLDAAPITSAIIVVDENPAPVAAEMTFGPAMAPLQFEMRVRVNQYSNIRVIAENADGAYMGGRFVKASGGCSAPATKDPELALASMGKMKLKHFDDIADALPQSRPRRDAQIMIRHPNYSGLQRDQVTQLFIGAHFISDLEVYQGDELLFRLEGGISVSENPVFRFSYNDNGATDLRITAEDTEGNVFQQILPKEKLSL